jgi:hypothetical protein
MQRIAAVRCRDAEHCFLTGPMQREYRTRAIDEYLRAAHPMRHLVDALW